MEQQDLKVIRDSIEAHEYRAKIFRERHLESLADSTKVVQSWWIIEYAIYCKAEGVKNDLPKELRVPVLIALRRMKHNTTHNRFVHYLEMTYPAAAWIYKLMYPNRTKG